MVSRGMSERDLHKGRLFLTVYRSDYTKDKFVIDINNILKAAYAHWTAAIKPQFATFDDVLLTMLQSGEYVVSGKLLSSAPLDMTRTARAWETLLQPYETSWEQVHAILYGSQSKPVQHSESSTARYTIEEFTPSTEDSALIPFLQHNLVKRRHNVVLVGAAGCGKSCLIQTLCMQHGVQYFGTADELKEVAAGVQFVVFDDFDFSQFSTNDVKRILDREFDTQRVRVRFHDAVLTKYMTRIILCNDLPESFDDAAVRDRKFRGTHLDENEDAGDVDAEADDLIPTAWSYGPQSRSAKRTHDDFEHNLQHQSAKKPTGEEESSTLRSLLSKDDITALQRQSKVRAGAQAGRMSRSNAKVAQQIRIRQADSIRINKTILKASADDPDVFDALDAENSKYAERMSNLLKFNLKSKKSTKVNTHKAEWIDEQLRLQTLSKKLEMSVSSHLESAISSGEDEALMDIVDRMNGYQSARQKSQKEIVSQLQNIKQMIRSGERRRGGAGTGAGAGAGAGAGTGTGESEAERALAERGVFAAHVAELLMKIRTDQARVWAYWGAQESQLRAEVGAAAGAVVGALRRDGVLLQDAALREEFHVILAEVQGQGVGQGVGAGPASTTSVPSSPSFASAAVSTSVSTSASTSLPLDLAGLSLELELLMEEWLSRIAALDRMHQLRVLEREMERAAFYTEVGMPIPPISMPIPAAPAAAASGGSGSGSGG
ncbi:hypothetical protein B484DRAFT_424418, partial [Ochromonadaceae sp. CCMP2298]